MSPVLFQEVWVGNARRSSCGCGSKHLHNYCFMVTLFGADLIEIPFEPHVLLELLGALSDDS